MIFIMKKENKDYFNKYSMISKKMKKQNGITLIALVITVVVMLILAGVAIAAVVDGDGLFSKTREATEVYENATEEEGDLVQSMMNEIDNILSEIKFTLPTWPDGIILRQMDYFDGVFTKPIKSDAKNRSVIDILYHRLDKAKNKAIKKVMENYSTNYSGCKFYQQ